MKWTPKKVAELRELAPTGLGAALLAGRLGATITAVYVKANRLGIPIARHAATYERRGSADVVHARWAILIGPMKERLRADIAAEGG